jgi:hypothetical protein
LANPPPTSLTLEVPNFIGQNDDQTGILERRFKSNHAELGNFITGQLSSPAITPRQKIALYAVIESLQVYAAMDDLVNDIKFRNNLDPGPYISNPTTVRRRPGPPTPQPQRQPSTLRLTRPGIT